MTRRHYHVDLEFELSKKNRISVDLQFKSDNPRRLPEARSSRAAQAGARQTGAPVPGSVDPWSNQISSTLTARAGQAVGRAIRSGALFYRRDIMLPRLLPLTPAELADTSVAMRASIIRRLARALRSERARAGHWSYSLNRHIGLLQAYRAEMAMLCPTLRDLRALGIPAPGRTGRR